MTTTERPLRKDAERNRGRILEAARELFAQRGLGVTLNDIAHHAGVGVGTVYRRFPDKARLIDELFEQQVDEMVGLMEAAVEDPDPWRGLTGFLRQNLELQTRNRALRELVLGTRDGMERVGRIRARMLPLGTRLVQRAKEAGCLRPDFDPADIPILMVMLTTIVDAGARRRAQPVAALHRGRVPGPARGPDPTGAAHHPGAQRRGGRPGDVGVEASYCSILSGSPLRRPAWGRAERAGSLTGAACIARRRTSRHDIPSFSSAGIPISTAVATSTACRITP